MKTTGIWRKISICKIGHLALAVMLAVLIMGNPQVFAGNSLVVSRRTAALGKGLMLDPAVALYGASGPSFSDLKTDRFAVLGTEVWSDCDWPILTKWIKSVHAQGLQAFTLIGIEHVSLTTMIDLVKKSASAGADIMVLDEVLARYEFNQTQLQSILNAGLQANPKLQFILDEYLQTTVTNAYLWTAKYPSALVATDNYFDKSVIDWGMQLAARYGKSPLVWLIFVPDGTQDFDTLVNLDAWMAYVKARNITSFFWFIDSSANWRTQWAKVAAF
jgi:hypothetical protein